MNAHIQLYDVQGCATTLLTNYSYSSLRELGLGLTPLPEGMPLSTFGPAISSHALGPISRLRSL